MAVPYTFANATSAIPLSQLDSNFATAVTIGNVAVQLGNTATTLGNVTLANVTITSVSSPITVTQGGTGNSSAFTANAVVYAPTTSTLATGSGLTFNGTTFTVTNDASINGITVGRGAGSVSSNTAIGYQAGYSNTSGPNNTYIGYQSGVNNTNTTGNNTFVGNASGALNTGSYNAVVGSNAMNASGAGSENVAMGFQAMSSNTSGSYNVGIGRLTLSSNLTASYNTALGYQALKQITTGSYNTAIGNAGNGIVTTGNSNVAIGYNAMNNGTGSRSAFNIAIGGGTLSSFTLNSDYGFNICIGQDAGTALVSGIQNTFIGTGLGIGSGRTMTGNYNTILGGFTGNQSGLNISGSSNYIVLSDGEGTPKAYQTSTGGWYQTNNSATWSITSDARVKTNIKPLETGLNIINSLNPVEFDYIIDGKHDISFLAQEYEKVLPNQVSETFDIDDEIKALTNGEPLKQLNQNLIPYLVKAIQELNAKVIALETKLGV